VWRLGVCIVVLIFLPSRRLTSVLACINRPSMAILVRISSLVSCSNSTWLGVGRYALKLVTVTDWLLERTGAGLSSILNTIVMMVLLIWL
jgi:hypothetical protein